MKRRLVTERLYSLGDFKNIKFVDEIDGITEDIWKDKDVVNKLRRLQTISIERAFQEYFGTYKNKITPLKLEDERIKLLDELQTELMSDLEIIFENGKMEE